MREYEKYVEQVPQGKVGKLVPGPGETPRSIAMRISRAARRTGKSANTWVVDGVVYFTVAWGSPSRRTPLVSQRNAPCVETE